MWILAFKPSIGRLLYEQPQRLICSEELEGREGFPKEGEIEYIEKNSGEETGTEGLSGERKSVELTDWGDCTVVTELSVQA